MTVAVDADDAESLGPQAGYRLVTLPAEPRADREFASLLRAADETMGAVTVEAGSGLEDQTVEQIEAAIVAVRGIEDEVIPLPAQTRPLAAGETVYVVARPARIRELELAADHRPDAD